MKKNIIVILIAISALLFIGGGIVLMSSKDNNNGKETVLREPKTKDVYGDLAITGEKLNKNHQYNDLIIKNISFQKRGEIYIFEMTVENTGTERFYEKQTEMVFYTNTEEKIGSEKITLPVLEPNQSEYVMLQIKDSKFFSACDFKLKKIQSIKYNNEEEKITQQKPAQTG